MTYTVLGRTLNLTHSLTHFTLNRGVSGCISHCVCVVQIRPRTKWVHFKLCVQVLELSDQLTQFQERLLDQTEEVQRTSAQLELMRRERDTMNTEHSDQMRQLVNERTQLQVC